MSGTPMDDRDLARALAAHAPQAPTGLRDRIGLALDVTPQQGRLPAVVWPLFDADPLGRRRALVLFAALLATALLAGAAVVGAFLLDRQARLAINPEDDPHAYLIQAYEGFANLPAFRLVGSAQEARVVLYSDGHGRLRTEDPETGITRISTHDDVLLLSVGPDGSPVALDLGRPDSAPGRLVGGLSSLMASCDEDVGGTGCLRTCDPALVAYLGPARLLDRPVHRIRCGDMELWMDVETRLPLRNVPAEGVVQPTFAPPGSPGDPSPAPIALLAAWEVLELDLAPQPEALFSVTTPEGFERIAATDPRCAEVRNGECREANASLPSARPTPAPGTAAGPAPDDAYGLAMQVIERLGALPPVSFEVDAWDEVAGSHEPTGPPLHSRIAADGHGRYRQELGDDPPTVYLEGDGHLWNSSFEDGRTVWRDNWGWSADREPSFESQLRFPRLCAPQWALKGVEVVGGREAYRLACGAAEFWVDREHLVVLRSAFGPTDPLDLVTHYAEVSNLAFGALPANQFQLPPGADVKERPTAEP